MLTAVALMGMIGLLASTVMKEKLRFKRKMYTNLDLAVARTIIKSSISCEKSMEEKVCTPNQIVELLKRDKSVYMPRTGKGLKIGKWNFKAVCNDRGNGILVRFAQLKESGTVTSTANSNFRKDPITQEYYTWSGDDALLYGKNATICPDSSDFAFEIAKSCKRIRTRAYNADFGVWCPEKQPNLYSCLQVDNLSPGDPTRERVQALDRCPNDQACSSRGYRTRLGADGLYYERASKIVNGKKIDGCFLYDYSHSHTWHKADILCCK